MSKFKKISIILVSYNTKNLTIQAINSIYEKTHGVNFEIIVVDNNSSDGTVQEINKNFQEVIVISNPTNSGFGVANNMGSQLALGEYLFFLNTDTIILNNAVEILSSYLDEHKNIGAAGGNLYTKELLPANSIERLFPGILSEINIFFFDIPFLVYYKKSMIFNHTNSVMTFKGKISGADLMIRTDLFKKVGMFDEDFFMYYEETELLFRVCQEGFKVASVPDAKIIHLEGASEDRKELTLMRYFDSRWKFFRKINKIKWINLIHFIFKLTALQRIIIFFIFRDKKRLNYWRKLMKIESESFSKRM